MKNKIKSTKNKTIDFSLEEGESYLKNCIQAEKFQGEENVTVLGDLFVAIKGVKDQSIDLLIVDPPYNLSKNFHGKSFKKIDKNKYAKYSRKWIEAILPKLKKNASIYVCCDWESSLVLGDVLSEFFILRNRITWQREKGRGAKSNWKNSMEDIFYCTMSNDYTFNLQAVKQRRKVLAPYKENGVAKDWKIENGIKFRDTCPSNFWDDIAIPYWSMPENTAHPTQKPEKLLAKLILASSNKNDLVLDPFAGSGSTGVVAKKLDRKFINIEQNPLYCAWAESRLKKAEADKNIQGYVNGIFWERNSKPF